MPAALVASRAEKNADPSSKSLLGEKEEPFSWTFERAVPGKRKASSFGTCKAYKRTENPHAVGATMTRDGRLLTGSVTGRCVDPNRKGSTLGGEKSERGF